MAKQYGKEVKGVSSRLGVADGTRPVQLKIAYIGGGSRNWAVGLMCDLAACPHLGGEVRLYDIDHEAAAFNQRYGTWIQTHPDAKGRWAYRAVKSLGEALRGADFVFCSIQPGPIDYFISDLLLPERYGIYQAVGDTVGPGGCSRALRSVRAYKVIAEAIAEHCPKAWVLNFTNPMTVCTRALYAVFPAIRAYGCCHEVFGTQHLLGRIYSEQMGGSPPPREEVRVNVLGINHFTWIDRAECRGTDLLTLLDKHLEKPGVVRPYTGKDVKKYPNVFACAHQVAFELYRRFGVLGAAGDRHLAEFVPWFITSKTSCHRWGFVLTPAEFRREFQKKMWAQRRQELASGSLPKLGGSGEEYLNQMLALVGRLAFRTNVNLPNRGQMQNAPLGAVVETNALFSRDSVEPIASGALPDPVNSLVQRHVINQESIVRAALTGDKDLAFQVFLNDPLMRLDIDRAWMLFNEMLRATKYDFKARG